ncbi:carboxymuconolactone decarboxylase family protein [Mycolicibacterium arseniciresistens]|uniref:Carboxymuconolactone decarboxylase family protein n=1 Tax=Mycolicibacterium arseniciresistens TaxID=3062257 RepID=A0ABT8U8N9_9MYCO|nr:carboxymuconolactone decarboxylase family protein [Mycolicibacterium arseniciresistens]MDO3634156.1 carboxymuconolactone decarboxylase family protein [Mycolicibacterium arseniciresistens]
MVQPLSADEWGDDEYAAFGKLLGAPGHQVPRAGSGHAYDPLKFPVVGLLARHPKLAEAFLTFNAYLLQRGELSTRLRELVILRVAYGHRSAFEWGQHVTMALAAGVTPQEINQIPRGAAAFVGIDGLVLTAADELVDAGTVSGETWDLLVADLGTHQAMEVIFIVGAYVTTGMAFGTWGLDSIPGSAVLPDADERHAASG